jgi:hypothetical protein
MRAALFTPVPGRPAGVEHPDDARPPDLSAVHHALPDAREWCETRDWPAWKGLPARLHDAAKLTVHVLAKVDLGQGQLTLRLGNCRNDDGHQILAALRNASRGNDHARGPSGTGRHGTAPMLASRTPA